MADLLSSKGKQRGMEGIKAEIASILLLEASGAVIDTVAITGTSFDVSGAGGQLDNNVKIDFDIAAGDVGKTASIVALYDSVAEMLRVDLETAIPLTTEGTATIAIGDFTADL